MVFFIKNLVGFSYYKFFLKLWLVSNCSVYLVLVNLSIYESLMMINVGWYVSYMFFLKLILVVIFGIIWELLKFKSKLSILISGKRIIKWR